jgi:hypothetical protein
MRRRGLGSILVGFGAALAVVIAYDSHAGNVVWSSFITALSYETYDVAHSWTGALAWRTLYRLVCGLQELFPLLLALGGVATIAGVVGRSVAWLRVRDGRADPLDRLRSRRRLQRVLTATPAALASMAGGTALVADVSRWIDGARRGFGGGEFWLRETLCDGLVAAAIVALLYGLTRAGMRALVAPLDTEATPPKGADELVFSAVAVTARTRGAVAALAAATVAMVGWTLVAPSSGPFLAALATYVAAALASPFLLQRASRIAVGIDGVWVRDATQTRFFAFRELDEAQARGADLVLVRGGRVVLRLQMHGEDAGRRDEVLARVNDAVTRSRATTSRGAEMMVKALPARRVAASAMGADSYRVPSVTREQLWELVEGPTTGGETRTAAAHALSTALDDAERSRLRVAAARCAEPRVRIALGTLAGVEDAEDAALPALQRSALPGHRSQP